MTPIDVKRIRQLISAAIVPHQHRGIEQDRTGAYPVTTLSRPGFAELANFALQNPTALMAISASITDLAERVTVCEALSEVSDPSTIPFWKDIVENQTNEDLLACAAIGLARQQQAPLLERVETHRLAASSPRLLFHLGIARLILNDPRGVDHIIEMLRQENTGSSSATSQSVLHGPTMRFIALSILGQILPKGPGEDVAEWPSWWSNHRNQYRWII